MDMEPAYKLTSTDLREILEFAIARVELANEEGDPILSAWLPQAKHAVAFHRKNGMLDAAI